GQDRGGQQGLQGGAPGRLGAGRGRGNTHGFVSAYGQWPAAAPCAEPDLPVGFVQRTTSPRKVCAVWLAPTMGRGVFVFDHRTAPARGGHAIARAAGAVAGQWFYCRVWEWTYPGTIRFPMMP